MSSVGVSRFLGSLWLVCVLALVGCSEEPRVQRAVSAARPLGPRVVSPDDRATLDAERVFEARSASIVVVEALDRRRSVVAQGSGVIVARNVVATSWPLVRIAFAIQVRDRQGSREARLDAVAEPHGLARLGVEARDIASLGRDPLPAAGSPLFVIGAPRGDSLAVVEGPVVGAREPGPGRAEQVEGALGLASGFVGGGAFDAHADLVGIATPVRPGDASGLFIPIRYVKDLLALPSGSLPRVSESPLRRLAAADRRWLLDFMNGVAQGGRPLTGLGLDRVNLLLDRLDPLVGGELERVKLELGLGQLAHQRVVWEDAIEARTFRHAVKSTRRATLEQDLIALGILNESDVAAADAMVRAIGAHQPFNTPAARIDASERFLVQMIDQTDRTKARLEALLWEARSRP